MSRFGKHGLAINLVDGPRSMALLKDIERHFGKDIIKLDAEVCLFINYKLDTVRRILVGFFQFKKFLGFVVFWFLLP